METDFIRPIAFFLLFSWGINGGKVCSTVPVFSFCPKEQGYLTFFFSLFHRFDPDGKEWKERGVGKLKILKHPAKGTFRVLLRREQVHKIAVNHAISKDIELKPMQS